MSSFKRPRTPTKSSSSASSSPSSIKEPDRKSTRTRSASQKNLLCTLPPTCNAPRNQPTHLASTKDLEAHYATYHAHVCEDGECGCVFPEARLLELHQTECHDPISALRKEKGEKIFACHLSTCSRLFSSPKTRRLHLIDVHEYPREYFFAVTNKGVGGLLKRWGDGVSLLRKEWKDREEGDDGDDVMDEDEDKGPGGRPLPPHMARSGAAAAASPSLGPQAKEPDQSRMNTDPDPLESITSSMTSLSLVPPSIRFGRGGKSGGFQGGHGVPNDSISPEAASPELTRGTNANAPSDLEFQSNPNSNTSANIPVQLTSSPRTRGSKNPRGTAQASPTPALAPNKSNHMIPAQVMAAQRAAVKVNANLQAQIKAGRGAGAPVVRGIINIPGRSGGGRGRGVPRGRGRGGIIA